MMEIFVHRLNHAASMIYSAMKKLRELGHFVTLAFNWEYDTCKVRFKSTGDKVAGCWEDRLKLLQKMCDAVKQTSSWLVHPPSCRPPTSNSPLCMKDP